MGSRNRTMAQNVAIVKELPKGARAIVYIGINLGSFTSAQKTATITLPSPLPTDISHLDQPHQYSTETGILSTARKKALVQGWLADRYPVFKRNFGSSAGVLETLIKVCQTRGYKPVLFELPRDTAVIGSSLGAPTTRFRDKCKALATKYEIPWVSLVSAARAAQLQLLRPLAPGGAGPQDVAGPAQRQDRGPAQAVRLRWRRLVTLRPPPRAGGGQAGAHPAPGRRPRSADGDRRAGPRGRRRLRRAHRPRSSARLPRRPPASSPALIAPLGEELRGNDYGKDWQHCVQVVANLRAEKPKVPLVVLLGGSSARECTVLDDDWERQIERRSGYVVDAYNLGSKHRTYAQDLAFVKLLPADVPTIVYIGVNLGRFCLPVGLGVHHAAPRRGRCPTTRSTSTPPGPHPELLREALLRLVLAVGPLPRVPRQLQRRARHAAEDHPRLQAAPPAGRAGRPAARPAGHRLVVRRSRLPLPRRLLEPRPRLGRSRGCTSTPRRASRDRDFFDIFHLVEPGRVKYQSILSDRTIRLLKQYRMPKPQPTPPVPFAEHVAVASASASPAPSI